MIDLARFLWIVSLISFILRSLQVLRKAISMSMSSTSPGPSSSPSFLLAGFRSPVFSPKGVIFSPINRSQEIFHTEANPNENSRLELPVLALEEPVLSSCGARFFQENSYPTSHDLVAKGKILTTEETQRDSLRFKDCKEENLSTENESFMKKDAIFTTASERPQEKSLLSMCGGFSSPETGKTIESKICGKVRKRPARIIIPESYRVSGIAEVEEDLGEKEFQSEGPDFYMASKRGGRKAMEDGYEVITDVLGDSAQAYFGVFDGHGGRAAVDYVIEKLGKNIITAMGELEKAEDQIEQAFKAGYLTTDKGFLSQGVSGGTCASTVILKDGELHVANVGDCRVVLSRKGVAQALTTDHRPDREDERLRIENSGGYVNCRNGVWRVHGSLSISRAIGDVHLKDFIISEPETQKLQLTSDCQFLILASDGLWDKITNQEAVDVVMKHKNSIESCKMLVDMSSGRGSKDDITVMVVYLQNFIKVSA